jgi:recombination protein RecR
MLPKPVQDLIDDFASLPGIGPKSATRIVLHLLDSPKHLIDDIEKKVGTLHEKVRRCKICHNLAEADKCKICLQENRDQSKLLIIESPLDLISFENSDYNGLYQIVGGLISPLRGVTPENLELGKLVTRLNEDHKNLEEIIIALPTSLEGDATSVYIKNEILADDSYTEIKISRIARGLPTNSTIEYQDSQTLQNALSNRTNI